jgi:hypothetical protein
MYNKFIGGILIVVGVLVAGAGPLCSSLSEARRGVWPTGDVIFVGLGIMWFAAGLLLIIRGIALVRGD